MYRHTIVQEFAIDWNVSFFRTFEVNSEIFSITDTAKIVLMLPVLYSSLGIQRVFDDKPGRIIFLP